MLAFCCLCFCMRSRWSFSCIRTYKKARFINIIIHFLKILFLAVFSHVAQILRSKADFKNFYLGLKMRIQIRPRALHIWIMQCRKSPWVTVHVPVSLWAGP